jgi:hypothetical protein
MEEDIEQYLKAMVVIGLGCLAMAFLFWTTIGMAMLRFVFAKKPKEFYTHYRRGILIGAVGVAITALGVMFIIKITDTVRHFLLEIASTDTFEFMAPSLPVTFAALFLNYYVWVIPLALYLGGQYAYWRLCALDPVYQTKHIAAFLLVLMVVILGRQYIDGMKLYVANTCQIAEHYPEAPLSPALRDVFQC